MTTRTVTVPFHVSSTSAKSSGDGVFSLPLTPNLQVGHTAHPTVYLHNLAFVNSFANIDNALYDNAVLKLQVLGSDGIERPKTVTLPTGNYSLGDLEREIAKQVYDSTATDLLQDHADACDLLMNNAQAAGNITLTYSTHAPNTTTNGFHTNQGISVADVRFHPVHPERPGSTGVTFEKALTIDECQLALKTDPENQFFLASDGGDAHVLPPLTKAFLQGTSYASNEVEADSEASPPVHHSANTNITHFGFKPVMLEPDFVNNRVRILLGIGVSMTEQQQEESTLLKVLGVTQFVGPPTFNHDGPDSDATVKDTTGTATPDIPRLIFQELVANEAAKIDKTRSVAFHCPSLASGTYSTKGEHGDSQLALVPITVDIGFNQAWEATAPVKLQSNIAGTTLNGLTFYLTNEEGEIVNTLGERFEAVMVLEYEVPLK